jgi:DNA-binding response OmpR family regulator
VSRTPGPGGRGTGLGLPITKAIVALSHIPVIFLTALVKRDEAAEGRPIAGYYFLAKPFKGHELLDMLARVLSQPAT